MSVPRVGNWDMFHDPGECYDCRTGNIHPIDVDADGNGVWCDGSEAWNAGEPLTEDERAELVILR